MKTKTPPAQPATPRPELTFDGFGINGPDEYRTRLATFPRGIDSALVNKYGPLIAAAPAMLEALKQLAQETQKARKYIVISDGSGFAAYNATAQALLLADAAIQQAEGRA